MSLTEKLIEWGATRFKIPPIAMRMFKASNEVSGIDKKTLPIELVPLNTIQLSRGLLNFTIIQSKLDWVLPYWAEQQYNPKSSSFIPRSHTSLSINVTNRNWAAVGNMNCDSEPVIDPRGLLMPFKNGWSIDVWIKIDSEIFYPSRSENVSQRLVDNVPVVETLFTFKNIDFQLLTYMIGNYLTHQVHYSNLISENVNIQIIFAVRPFNPEGISLINDLEFIKEENSFLIGKKDKVYFDTLPDFIHCSSYKEGDAVSILLKNVSSTIKSSSKCDIGLASAIACFNINLKNKETGEKEISIPLKEDKKIFGTNKKEIISYWNDILSEGTAITTPDVKLNSILKSSLTTLLMLIDDDIITPGPFTYHQFWFRDAAYMILALDNFGFGKYTKKIIESFSKYQHKDGYFRSQQGEWDSNGQALWSVYHHYNLYKDKSLLQKLFDNLFLGVKWISKKRLTQDSFKDDPFFGLMPVGLSAEHLGLADHYYWDNFWSLAGLKCFIEICKILDKKTEEEFTQTLFDNYSKDLERSLALVQSKFSIDSIPASPSRSVDCGMIGSICASYPLQFYDASDHKIISTLKTLEENYFIDGLFFQHFIHSGYNIYLTLQTAHAYLFAGNREKFIEFLDRTISFASPTLNFPEAIHPITKGGAMGDGHHGWASAEIALAVHDAIIFERKCRTENEFVFFQGVPKDWFLSDSGFSIRNAPVSCGKINADISCEDKNINIKIYLPGGNIEKVKWLLSLPFNKINILEGKDYVIEIHSKENDIEIGVKPGKINLKLSV